MAFCAITNDDLKKLYTVAFVKINSDITKLKDIKGFSKELFDFLVSKGLSTEKAVSMVSNLPQIALDYNRDKANRAKIKAAQISMDEISDMEETFDDFSKLSTYLGLGKENPIQLVSATQLEVAKKVDELIANTKVEFVEVEENGKLVKKRKINGKIYEHRVTNLARAGYNFDSEEDSEESPALKHGNTVDELAKDVFEGNVSYRPTKFEGRMTDKAYEILTGKLMKLKADLEAQGFIFRAGVTVFDEATGIAGEIDLLAIDKEGKMYIWDFKTVGNKRFNADYLKKDKLSMTSMNVEINMLPKWEQYGTQGIIYSKMLSKMTGQPVDESMTLIGISLRYDTTVPAVASQIDEVVEVVTERIGASGLRSEYKGKTLPEILEESKKLNKLDMGQPTEVPKKTRTIKKFGNKRGSLDRIAAIDEIAATDEELKAEVDWFKSNPISKGVLLNIDNMVNSGLFGNWSFAGITLYQNASKGTMYHEGWHLFSQVFMSKDDKLGLYESVAKDAIDFTSRDGRKLNTATASLLDVEEFLAEEFAKYALNPSEYKYPSEKNKKPKNLFQRIWEFLQRYFGSGEKNRPIDIFQKLYRGKISEYQPSVNNAIWGNLNSIATNGGKEIIPNHRVDLYARSFDFLIGEELRKAGKSFTAFKQSKTLRAGVIKHVFAAIEEKYVEVGEALDSPNSPYTEEQFFELEQILENKHEFTNLALSRTAYASLKDYEVDEDVFTMSIEDIAALEAISDDFSDLEDINEEEDASYKENWDRTGNEESALNLADKAIQDFFRSIPRVKEVIANPDGTQKVVYHTNELGFPENNKYYDVFYRTKKLLSGKFEMKDMLAEMNSAHNQRIFPELKQVADFIQQFINKNDDKNYYRRIQNMLFVTSFYNAMVMPEIANTQLNINYNALKKNYSTFKKTAVSYRKAHRNMSLKIITNWQTDFKDKRNKQSKLVSYYMFDVQKSQLGRMPYYVTRDGKLMFNPFVNLSSLNTSNAAQIQRIMELVGINLNSKVYEDAVAVTRLKEFAGKMLSNLRTYQNVVNLYLENLGYDGKDAVAFLSSLSADEMDAVAKGDKAGETVFERQGFFIDNPIKYFSETREFEGEKGIIKLQNLKFDLEEIAEIEEKYGDKVSSGAFRIEDKTKYPYYLPNQISIVTELLNRTKTEGELNAHSYLKHLSLNQPWMRRSFFMQKMFDFSTGQKKRDQQTGKDISIVLEDIASIRVETEDGITEKHPRSLSRTEKLFVDAITLFNSGAIEIPRAETSSTIFSVRLSSYGGSEATHLPIGFNEVLKSMSSLPVKFQQIIKDYLLSEIEKRQWYLQNKPKSVFATKFNLFEDILSDELKAKITENLSDKADEILSKKFDDNTTIEQQFIKEASAYFDDVVEKLKPEFDKIKGTTPEGTDQYKILKDAIGIGKTMNIAGTKPITKAFVLNQFILSSEFYQLYFGDLYFYKNPFKRGKIVTNTGSAMYVDEVRNEMLNDLHKETMHSIVTGVQQPRDFRNLKSATIRDVEMRSAYFSENDADNRLLQDSIAIRIATGRLDPNSGTYAESVAEIKKGLKSYEKINIADGQGVISLDFYKAFALTAAPQLWTESKEREYQRQKAIFRYHNNLYFTNVNGEITQMDEVAARELRAQDEAELKHEPYDYFNPLKISYTGPEGSEGPFKPVFDKFSVRPIIPEYAHGKRDQNLLMEMASKGYDYVKFESGSKVIQKEDPRFDWFKKVGDGTYNLNDYNVSIDHEQSLYAGYLKHQLNTEGIKEQNILGSQFRKIVFGVKYLSHVRNDEALSKYFRDLEHKFRQHIVDLIRVEENDLFNLLGVEQKPDGSYYVADMKRFIKLLNEESARRGMPVNNIDYIAYSEEKKSSKYPIDYAFNRTQIIDLLSGMIDNKLRRLKVTGSALIQVSQAGSEDSSTTFTNPTQEQLKQYGTAGLHYYHLEYDENGKPSRTSTMGVKVALTDKYESLFNLTHPDGEKIMVGSKKGNDFDYDASLKRLNEAMKNRSWKKKHSEKFMLIGYRIPTQNNNFIDHMEVMEFLPKSAGSIIIPPYELIIKSGSDFDIDKMNVIKPSFSNNGSVIKLPKESIDEINARIKELSYDEKDAKNLRRDMTEIMNEADLDWNKLLTIQRKVRHTMAKYVLNAQSDKLIDKIFNSFEKGEDVAYTDLSKVEKSEDEAFDDVEERQNPNAQMADKALFEFYKIDKMIQDLKKKFEGAEKRKNETDMSWFNKKRQYKDAKNNEVMNVLAEVISHPYYFELLVTPSTASMLEGFTNDLIASQRNYNEAEKIAAMTDSNGEAQPLYEKTKSVKENSRYDTSLEVFENFLGKRKDLGSFAIQRTFADIFNHINLSISRVYTTGKETKVIYTPLLAPTKRDRDRIAMHGEGVKDVFDQFISATVDLASSPFYSFLGVNNYNKKHVQFLMHQQVDPKVALWFLNQPILKEVYELVEKKQRDGVKGYSLKHALVELGLKYKFLDNPDVPTKWGTMKKKYQLLETMRVPLTEEDENFDEDDRTKTKAVPNPKKANTYLPRPYRDFNNNLDESDHFTFDELDAAIRNNDSKSEFQGKVLSYFASMIEEADMLMKLQFAYNTDTTKYSTLTSIMKNRDNKREVKESDLFDKSQLEKLEKETMISPFDYTSKAYDIYKALFPKLYTNNTLSTFRTLADDVFGANATQMERISKIIENDYIEFVYKNFGRYRGQNISDYFIDKIMRPQDSLSDEFFTDKFIQLKNDYPELDEIPFVKALYEDKYIPSMERQDSYKGYDNMEIRNLFFLRNPDNPVSERDTFTNNWRNLIAFSPEKLGLKENYSPEDVQKISQFFNELIYFSLYQSGLTNNSNGFSDLIPYERWGMFIQEAFANMESAFEKNNTLEAQYLAAFELRARQMNPKINWRTKHIISNEEVEVVDKFGRVTFEEVKEEIKFFKNYYRGKDYRVTKDDINVIINTTLYDAEAISDEKQVQATKPQVPTEHKIEVGRYVSYNGDIYIVTKPSQKRPGVWQIYNPTKEGRGANLSVSEKNLIARSEMGKVVTYGEKEYLVTAKEEIVDMVTYKKVRMTNNDPNRKAIVNLAKSQAKKDGEGDPNVC